jgi:hypothetical protein
LTSNIIADHKYKFYGFLIALFSSVTTWYVVTTQVWSGTLAYQGQTIQLIDKTIPAIWTSIDNLTSKTIEHDKKYAIKDSLDNLTKLAILNNLQAMEWRLNRLDKAHNFQPKEWQNIEIPRN